MNIDIPEELPLLTIPLRDDRLAIDVEAANSVWDVVRNTLVSALMYALATGMFALFIATQVARGGSGGIAGLVFIAGLVGAVVAFVGVLAYNVWVESSFLRSHRLVATPRQLRIVRSWFGGESEVVDVGHREVEYFGSEQIDESTRAEAMDMERQNQLSIGAGSMIESFAAGLTENGAEVVVDSYMDFVDDQLETSSAE
jgi:hypothetical protein